MKKRLSLILTEEMHARAKAMAKKKEIPLTVLIKMVLAEYLENNEKSPS